MGGGGEVRMNVKQQYMVGRDSVNYLEMDFDCICFYEETVCKIADCVFVLESVNTTTD